MDEQTLQAIAALVHYNWTNEENDYNGDALLEGNSRDGHIFEDLMLIQKWLETQGYPHVEPQICCTLCGNPLERDGESYVHPEGDLDHQAAW